MSNCAKFHPWETDIKGYIFYQIIKLKNVFSPPENEVSQSIIRVCSIYNGSLAIYIARESKVAQ